MSRLRPLPYREVARKLHVAGFQQVSQRGSHVKFTGTRDGQSFTVIVPRHTLVHVGILSSIIKQSGLTRDEFLAL